MPSSSKKQHNFMEAVAHSPSFAKKVGVPQSVGKDFSAADKGRKFVTGGATTPPTTSTPPKPLTLTPQQQRTLAANAAAQRQAAAEQEKSVALQNRARQVANANKLYTYEQPTKEDLMRAESLRQANTMDWSRGTPFGYMSGAVLGSGKMPADVAKEIQRLKSPKLVTRASPEQGYVRDDINNPFIHAMQTDDLNRAQARGHDYQTAADGTVYDVATSAGKKEFDENNAYWKSVGGYQLGGMKKGGKVNMSTGGATGQAQIAQARAQAIADAKAKAQAAAQDKAQQETQARAQAIADAKAKAQGILFNAEEYGADNYGHRKMTPALLDLDKKRQSYADALSAAQKTYSEHQATGQFDQSFLYGTPSADVLAQSKANQTQRLAADKSALDKAQTDYDKFYGDLANRTIAAYNDYTSKGGTKPYSLDDLKYALQTGKGGDMSYYGTTSYIQGAARQREQLKQEAAERAAKQAEAAARLKASNDRYAAEVAAGTWDPRKYATYTVTGTGKLFSKGGNVNMATGGATGQAQIAQARAQAVARARAAAQAKAQQEAQAKAQARAQAAAQAKAQQEAQAKAQAEAKAAADAAKAQRTTAANAFKDAATSNAMDYFIYRSPELLNQINKTPGKNGPITSSLVGSHWLSGNTNNKGDDLSNSQYADAAGNIRKIMYNGDTAYIPDSWGDDINSIVQRLNSGATPQSSYTLKNSAHTNAEGLMQQTKELYFVEGGDVNTEDRSTINAAEEQGFRFNPDRMSAEEENAAQLRQALAEANRGMPRISVHAAKPESAAEKAKADKAMREGSENEANAMGRAKSAPKPTAESEIAKIQPQLDALAEVLKVDKGYKKGGSIKKSSDKKWIGKAIKKPGALRESLGVKKGEKIPAKKLAEAAKKPGKTGQRARLAQTLKGFKEGGSVRGGGCESRGRTRCKFV